MHKRAMDRDGKKGMGDMAIMFKDSYLKAR